MSRDVTVRARTHTIEEWSLERLAEKLEQSVLVLSAEDKSAVVVHNDSVFTAKQRMQLFDAFDIYDRRAVDPQESLRI